MFRRNAGVAQSDYSTRFEIDPSLDCYGYLAGFEFGDKFARMELPD